MTRERFGRWSSRAVMGFIVGALAVGSLVGCGREKEPRRRAPTSPAEEFLVEVAGRYAGLESFAEETAITKTVSTAEGEERTSYRTELSFRAPNHLLYRLENGDASVIACDGQRVIAYSSERGGYVEEEAPEELAALVRDHHTDAVGIDELLLLADADPLEILTDVSLSEGESISGQAMRVLKGNLREMGEEAAEDRAAGRQTLWIGADDGLVHKMVLEITRGGAELRVEEVMEEVAPNPSLSDEVFEYQPPARARDLAQE